MDKKIFLGLPLGAIALLLASIIFDLLVEIKLDFLSKVILIAVCVVIFIVMKLKLFPDSDKECDKEKASSEHYVYGEFEVEIDHEEMKKAKEGEDGKISPFANEFLQLDFSGEGRMRKKVVIYGFEEDVRECDVNILRESLKASHTSWEDLLALPDLESKEVLVAFATTGISQNHVKLVAARTGDGPLATTFQEARFESGTLFPLVLDVQVLN